MIEFQHINYKTLNARQKEQFNFQKIAGVLADYGFNCIKLADDWQGADFLAYHKDKDTTLKVQLKSRITIAKKYHGKDLWIAFPHDGFWYLIEHDQLVDKVQEYTNWLGSNSWLPKDGEYNSVCINSELLRSLSGNKLGPVYGAVSETDD
jgi:frataxin-like iron-binding protein CyaY